MTVALEVVGVTHDFRVGGRALRCWRCGEATTT